MRTVLIYCEQNCKPGSVFDSHLSRRAVASVLQPPRERPGRPFGGEPRCSHTGVAPDRVYSDGQFPAVGCALTAPFHPYRHSAAVAAVYLCCTFPEVAFGGRYPLFLPCGARTFLMAGLSPPPCDCLSYSRDILQDESPFVNKRTRKSTKIRFQLRLIVLRCLRTRVRRPLERLPEFTPCARRPLSGILFAGETHPRIERSDVI